METKQKDNDGGNAPGPILELLSNFRKLHVDFIRAIKSGIPDFEEIQMSSEISSNLTYYLRQYCGAWPVSNKKNDTN